MKKVTLTNVFPNPSFEDDMPFSVYSDYDYPASEEHPHGWFSYPTRGATLEDSQNLKGEYSSEYKLYGARSMGVTSGMLTGSPSSMSYFKIVVPAINKHRYYVRASRMFLDVGVNPPSNVILYFYRTKNGNTLGGIGTLNFSSSRILNEWKAFSSAGVANSGTTNQLFASIMVSSASAAYIVRKHPLLFDGFMLIDLTEAFGAGNEPTKAWCDEHIPFFTGTMELDAIDLVTDRTQEDVDYLNKISISISNGTATDQEKEDFLSAKLKGAYNYTDLNRVGEALNYIADLLNNTGYAVDITPKTDWENGDIPTQQQLNNYIADIYTVRNKVTELKNPPALPSDMENLTYISANNIEQLLEDIDTIVSKMSLSWFYCGDELFCGEV